MLAALIIVFTVPKKSESIDAGQAASAASESGSVLREDSVWGVNESGDLLIYADRLSADQVSFIRVSKDSKIELLARKGDDGKAKAALGTCQSCNGSPGAFYSQEGEELKCNNCGLTFPLSVLDAPGGGCHPIMLDEQSVSYQGNDILIHTAELSAYEGLFSNVADH